MKKIALPGGGFISLAPNDSNTTISFVLNVNGLGLGKHYTLDLEKLVAVEGYLDRLTGIHNAVRVVFNESVPMTWSHMHLRTQTSVGVSTISAALLPILNSLEANSGGANVYISLPQKDINLASIEKIQNACGDFMEAMGYELEQKEEPVFGSFFQKIRFILTSKKTHDEIADIYSKGKMALEQAHLNLPNAEITEKMAMAATNVMASLANVDEAVIRLAGIVVVKYQNESGKTRVTMTTLSPELTILFDANPQLMNEPATVFNMIEAIKNQPNKFVVKDEVLPPPVL